MWLQKPFYQYQEVFLYYFTELYLHKECVFTEERMSLLKTAIYLVWILGFSFLSVLTGCFRREVAPC